MGYMSDTYAKMPDWNKKKNNLTWELFEQGYTPDNHPEHVEWVDYRYEFEYTNDYLLKSIWESPCGLLRKGISTTGKMGYMGIDWQPENNNPVFRCPHSKENCKLNHEYLKKAIGHKKDLVQCAFHISDKDYDYEKSYEKVWDEFYAMQEQKRIKFYKRLKWKPNALHCECIRWDDAKQGWYARYDPWVCVDRCWNDTCVLTGKRLDGKKGNVFYDVKITRICHDGTIWDGEKIINITKGKKMFDSPKPLTICESYAKLCQDQILFREESRFTQELFFKKDMTVEIVNVRAEYRESRDLLQDLRDVQEGIKVTHASDESKAKKEAKRERSKQYQEAKKRKSEKKIIKNLARIISTGVDSEGNPTTEVMKNWAKKQLKERGIKVEQIEQLSLF